jgi:hypothetical protein
VQGGQNSREGGRVGQHSLQGARVTSGFPSCLPVADPQSSESI